MILTFVGCTCPCLGDHKQLRGAAASCNGPVSSVESRYPLRDSCVESCQWYCGSSGQPDARSFLASPPLWLFRPSLAVLLHLVPVDDVLNPILWIRPSLSPPFLLRSRSLLISLNFHCSLDSQAAFGSFNPDLVLARTLLLPTNAHRLLGI